MSDEIERQRIKKAIDQGEVVHWASITWHDAGNDKVAIDVTVDGDCDAEFLRYQLRILVEDDDFFERLAAL